MSEQSMAARRFAAILQTVDQEQLSAVVARLSGICSAGLIVSVIARIFPIGGQAVSSTFLILTVIFAFFLAFLRLSEINTVARGFLGVAVVGTCLTALVAPGYLIDVWRAALQGGEFSAFLLTLGLLRGLIRKSGTISLAAEYLFNLPQRLQKVGIVIGSEFLSVLFNIGVIGVFADISSAHNIRRGREGLVDEDAVVMSAVHGAVLCSAWNPLGLGFAIITAAIPTLNATLFMVLAFVAAMGISVIPVLSCTSCEKDIPPLSVGKRCGKKAMVVTLIGIAILIAVTACTHVVSGASFLASACFVLPLSAVFWSICEGTGKMRKAGISLASLSEASAVMASEATIFLAANVVAGFVSPALYAIGAGHILAETSFPDIVVILGAMLLVPLAGAMLIPHSIVMIIVAQFLGCATPGTEHPFALAFALCYAWTFALPASPISATSIIAARYLRVSSTTMSFVYNRNFTLAGLSAGGLIVLVVYGVENILLH